MKFHQTFTISPNALFLPSTVVAGISIALVGCVDPGQRFKEFNARIVDAGVASGTDAAIFDELPDITGSFYLAMEPEPMPGVIFHMAAGVDFTSNGDGTATIHIELQPLHRENRTPVGPPLTITDISVSNTGQFSAEANGMIDGQANPVTGSDLTVAISLEGSILSENIWCGTVNGQIIAPLMLPLDGSTFASIRVAPGTTGQALPEPVFTCPELTPPGDDDQDDEDQGDEDQGDSSGGQG
jgi:hypothetical protein